VVPGLLCLVQKHNREVLHGDRRVALCIEQQFIGSQSVVAGAFPWRQVRGRAQIGPALKNLYSMKQSSFKKKGQQDKNKVQFNNFYF